MAVLSALEVAIFLVFFLTLFVAATLLGYSIGVRKQDSDDEEENFFPDENE